jgi:hypothetical protein
MRAANYLLFRYELRDEDDHTVGGRAHDGIFEDVKGKPAGYRSEDAISARTNVLMRLRKDNIIGEYALTFDVGYKITDRVEKRWNEATDEYDFVPVGANDLMFTSFVALPRFGVVAVRDGSSDQLSALSGIGRLRSIVAAHSDHILRYSRSAEAADVDRAMQTLRLTEFSFDVRPFNPHPRNPGEKLHELMKEAGVGRFKGKAQPTSTTPMKPDEDGIIAEAVGLARAGYGQFALKAETATGAKLSYGKPPFQQDKARSAAVAERPRMLKVAVPHDDPDMTEQEHVVSVMLELFGDKQRTA